MAKVTLELDADKPGSVAAVIAMLKELSGAFEPGLVLVDRATRQAMPGFPPVPEVGPSHAEPKPLLAELSTMSAPVADVVNLDAVAVDEAAPLTPPLEVVETPPAATPRRRATKFSSGRGVQLTAKDKEPLPDDPLPDDLLPPPEAKAEVKVAAAPEPIPSAEVLSKEEFKAWLTTYFYAKHGPAALIKLLMDTCGVKRVVDVPEDKRQAVMQAALEF